jgi:NAD(P)-dependent dehydrogenase (short-subunit alcohol dehydrogenase family)
MFELKNKTVLITGGVGLLGSTFSRRCAQCHANVVIIDIDEVKGEKLAEEIRNETGKTNVLFQKCDITSEEDIQNLIHTVTKKFKTVDVLVNNAYPKNKNFGRKFNEVSFKDFCENIDMNLGGYFLMAKKVSEIMVPQKRGSIINMGSIYGIVGPDFRIYEGTTMTMPVEYSAIKGGIITFTKYLATYLADYGIRVNSISPGGVYNNQPETFVKKYEKRVPLGRMANPEDIAGGIIFLASDESSYITGHNLVIDGGWSIW